MMQSDLRKSAAYASIADRVGILFQIVPLIHAVSPLYTFSLDFVHAIVDDVLRIAPAGGDRVAVVTTGLFIEIARGVLEMHRVLLTFFFTVALQRTD
jgi:hypothetical protein